MLDEFETYARRFEFRPLQRTLVDNRTGKLLNGATVLDAAYWRRHARQPVQYAESVSTLSELGCRVLLEVGPQPVLSGMALRAWPEGREKPKAVASLRREVPDERQLMEALGQVYVAGARPDFDTIYTSMSRHKLDLPTYPFQHRPYWYGEGRAYAAPTDAMRTETVRLLEDGRLEELAALVGDPNGNDTKVSILKSLAAQHNQQRITQTIADTRYEIRWEKSAQVNSNPKAGAGVAWLLIADDAETIAPLVDVLTTRGLPHRIVVLPESDADEEELEATLRAAAESDPALRILHLAILDPDGAMSTRSLERMQHRILGGTQRMFRAANAAELKAPVWLITRGAQRVTREDVVSPVQSCMWGFGRTASTEVPQLWGGLADLSTGSTDERAGLIGHILAGPQSEDQIALRDHSVYFARLSRRAEPPAMVQLELRGDASYLVTGGLGSVGLDIAEYLAAHGARQLVLTGRRPPSDAAQQRIDSVREQYGCQFRILAADVADPDAVTCVLSTVHGELPPLAGIVHAAGEFASGSLLTMDGLKWNARSREGLGWLASESSCVGHALGLLPAHLISRRDGGE